jgi:hypothetical protein
VLVKQLTTFLVKNKDLIKLWSKKFGEQLLKFAQELPAHLQALGQKFDEIKQKLQPLADRVGGFTNLIGLLAGAIIAGPLLAAIASLAAAFVSLGIAIAATPIGWILLGIGALAAAAALFVKDWAPIKEFFSDLWQDVRDVFSGFVDFVAGAFTLDMKRALGGLGRIIKGALSIATAGFKAPFAVFKAVTNTPIDSLAEGIQGDAEAFAEENAPTLRGPQLPNIADEPTLQRRPVIGAAALRTQSAASTVVERSERTSKVKIEVAAPRGTKVKLPRESNPDVEYQVGYISELAR